MTLSDKQLNKISRFILAQDEFPPMEEESDGASWRDDTEGELLLYADNTSEIYPMKQQIIKNMKKKIEKGVYDPEAAIQGWMHWVDNAAKMYAKEFLTEPYHQIFTKDVRMNVAREVAEREYDMIVNGEYDEKAARKVIGLIDNDTDLEQRLEGANESWYNFVTGLRSNGEYLYAGEVPEDISKVEMVYVPPDINKVYAGEYISERDGKDTKTNQPSRRFQIISDNDKESYIWVRSDGEITWD